MIFIESRYGMGRGRWSAGIKPYKKYAYQGYSARAKALRYNEYFKDKLQPFPYDESVKPSCATINVLKLTG